MFFARLVSSVIGSAIELLQALRVDVTTAFFILDDLFFSTKLFWYILGDKSMIDRSTKNKCNVNRFYSRLHA